MYLVRPLTEAPPPKPFSYLTTEEVHRIIDHTSNNRDRRIIETLYASAMRVNELTHLDISDIDFESQGNRMDHHIRNGKGGRPRRFYL